MEIDDQPTYSYRKSIIISVFGFILLFVGIFIEGGPSIWFILGRFTIKAVIYTIIIGVIAAIITLTMKASKRDALSIFAIIFLVASLFPLLSIVCN